MNLTRAHEVACTKIASVGDLAYCFWVSYFDLGVVIIPAELDYR